jgi:hypothetical protein
MTYEFSQDEDKIIEGVGIRGFLIGLLLILVAIVNTIKNVMILEAIDVLFILTMVQNVVAVMVAIAFILPFYDFRTLAKTEGKDIKEFMEGIHKMTLGFIIIIISMIIMVISEILRVMSTL